MLPDRQSIWSIRDPLRLADDDCEVVRFAYTRQTVSSAQPSIEIVYQHRLTQERMHFRYYDVVAEFLPPVQQQATVTVASDRARQWEGPRPLRIALAESDGYDTVLFYAADVERVPTLTTVSRRTGAPPASWVRACGGWRTGTRAAGPT